MAGRILPAVLRDQLLHVAHRLAPEHVHRSSGHRIQVALGEVGDVVGDGYEQAGAQVDNGNPQGFVHLCQHLFDDIVQAIRHGVRLLWHKLPLAGMEVIEESRPFGGPPEPVRQAELLPLLHSECGGRRVSGSCRLPAGSLRPGL